MTVDIMRLPKMEDQTAIQEDASQGLKSMKHLICVLSHCPDGHNVDFPEITDLTVSKFKKVISLLNRTSRARFRRGPVHFPPPLSSSAPPPSPAKVTPPSPAKISALVTFVQSNQQSVTLDFTRPNVFGAKTKSSEAVRSLRRGVSSNSSFMSSAITGDESISKGSSIFLAPAASLASSAKPPLSGLPY